MVYVGGDGGGGGSTFAQRRGGGGWGWGGGGRGGGVYPARQQHTYSIAMAASKHKQHTCMHVRYREINRHRIAANKSRIAMSSIHARI